MTVVDDWISPFWAAYAIYGGAVLVAIIIIVYCCVRCRRRRTIDAEQGVARPPTFAFDARTSFNSTSTDDFTNGAHTKGGMPTVSDALMEADYTMETRLPSPPLTPKSILRKTQSPRVGDTKSARFSEPPEPSSSSKRRLSFRRQDGTSEVRVEEYNRSEESDSVRAVLQRRLSERLSREELERKNILLRFDDNVQVETAEHYDRKGNPTWANLTPADKADIRKELNEFKRTEMEVHEDSKKFTRFHDDKPAPPAILESDVPFEGRVGQRVFVRGFGQGFLRFFGPHHVVAAPRCGVELDGPNGLNNGTVGGHKYFTCAPSHGILCDPRLVTAMAGRASLVLNSSEDHSDEDGAPIDINVQVSQL